MMSPDYLARGDFVYRGQIHWEAKSARGACLFDATGKRWIDLEAANGAALLGYDASIVERAAIEWATLPSVPSFVESTARKRYAHRLGAKLHEALGSKGRVAFDLGGAQGIELALRIASRRHPSRRTLVVLDGCYHGRTLSLSNVSSSLRYRTGLPSSGYRIVRLPVPELLARPGGLSLRAAEQLCTTLATESFRAQAYGVSSGDESDALAFIFEPVLNVAGLVEPSTAFLEHTIRLAREVGAVVIADEVFTGCYRTGPFVASEVLGAKPDMLVMSKALTNGTVPLSAVWGREELMDESAFPPGSYSTTFGNTPLHFVVANHVLDRLEGGVAARLPVVEGFLRELCAVIQAQAAVGVRETRVKGLTAYIELSSPQQREEVVTALANPNRSGPEAMGAVVGHTGLSTTRLLLHPPLTISEDEMRDALTLFGGISQCS